MERFSKFLQNYKKDNKNIQVLDSEIKIFWRIQNLRALSRLTLGENGNLNYQVLLLEQTCHLNENQRQQLFPLFLLYLEREVLKNPVYRGIEPFPNVLLHTVVRRDLWVKNACNSLTGFSCLVFIAGMIVTVLPSPTAFAFGLGMIGVSSITAVAGLLIATYVNYIRNKRIS